MEAIRDQQHRIGTACRMIYSKLANVGEAAKEYRTNRERTERAGEYTKEYKEALTMKAGQEYQQRVKPYFDEIGRNLDTIKEALTIMQQTPNFDGVQKVLPLAALGKNLSSSARFSLAEQFRGQPWALDVLASAFEAAGVSPDPYTKPLIFTAEGEAQKLGQAAQIAAAAKPGETAPAYKMAKAVEQMAQRVGADFDGHAGDIPGIDGGLEQAIAQAAGLGG